MNDLELLPKDPINRGSSINVVAALKVEGDDKLFYSKGYYIFKTGLWVIEETIGKFYQVVSWSM